MVKVALGTVHRARGQHSGRVRGRVWQCARARTGTWEAMLQDVAKRGWRRVNGAGGDTD